MTDAGVLERIGLGLAAVLYSAPFTVLLLKAKGWLCLVAVILPGVGPAAALVGGYRLAKPNSWWALNLYRSREAARARDRYPDAPTDPADILAGLGWLNLALTAAFAVVYAVGVVPP
jgi:hypothetical protein